MSTLELQEMARIEVNEDPSRRSEDIEAVREWLKKQPHINAQTDDESIVRFLRWQEFSLERTKEKIDLYYTTKTAIPQWFQNVDPQHPEIQTIMNSGFCFPLKNYDGEGRKVVLIRTGAWDIPTMSLDGVMKFIRMVVEVLAEDPQTQICGLIFLCDEQGASISLAGVFTPTVMNMVVKGWLDSMPVRVRFLEICRLPYFMEAVINVMMKLMKEEQRQRLHVQSGTMIEAYNKLGLPIDVIPAEYGGKGGTIQEIVDDFKQELEKRRDNFIQNDIYKVDENLRVGKSKTVEELLGTDGSFRKLNID